MIFTEPRHGFVNATYVIHYEMKNDFEIKVVAYDIDKTCKAIIAAVLPNLFAWNLRNGCEFVELAKDASHVYER